LTEQPYTLPDGNTLARYAEQARARWQHLPVGPERSKLELKTLRAIVREAELLTIQLPELSPQEEVALCSEAVRSVWSRYGREHMVPSAPMLEVLDQEVDRLYQSLCLAAREQRATPRTRELLLRRRLTRSLMHLPTEDQDTRRLSIEAVARLLSTEPDQVTRDEGESYAVRAATQIVGG